MIFPFAWRQPDTCRPVTQSLFAGRCRLRPAGVDAKETVQPTATKHSGGNRQQSDQPPPGMQHNTKDNDRNSDDNPDNTIGITNISCHNALPFPP
jgi:hypothetical protein